jgi:HEAT repeat protein
MALAFKGALTDTSDELARRSYYDNLIAMGEVSRPIIEGMVQDENRVLVRNGVAILGEIGGAGAVELVTTALADTDARVRREALLSLAKVGDESSGQLVLGFLEDSDADVRSAAAVAVGDLKVVRAQRRLIAMLDETSEPDALVPVLRALGQLGDPGAVQAIEKHAVRTLFSKPHVEVRIAAYQALQRIGTPHAKQLILAALTDKEPAVQAAVKRLMRASERPEPAT